MVEEDQNPDFYCCWDHSGHNIDFGPGQIYLKFYYKFYNEFLAGSNGGSEQNLRDRKRL